MTDWLADSANWGLLIACGTALSAALIISLTVSIAGVQIRRQIRRSGEDAVEQNQIFMRTVAARDTASNRVVSPQPASTQTTQAPAAPPAAPSVTPRQPTTEVAPAVFETRREARSDLSGSAIAEAHSRSAALNHDPLNQ